MPDGKNISWRAGRKWKTNTLWACLGYGFLILLDLEKEMYPFSRADVVTVFHPPLAFTAFKLLCVYGGKCLALFCSGQSPSSWVVRGQSVKCCISGTSCSVGQYLFVSAQSACASGDEAGSVSWLSPASRLTLTFRKLGWKKLKWHFQVIFSVPPFWKLSDEEMSLKGTACLLAPHSPMSMAVMRTAPIRPFRAFPEKCCLLTSKAGATNLGFLFECELHFTVAQKYSGFVIGVLWLFYYWWSFLTLILAISVPLWSFRVVR